MHLSLCPHCERPVAIFDFRISRSLGCSPTCAVAPRAQSSSPLLGRLPATTMSSPSLSRVGRAAPPPVGSSLSSLVRSLARRRPATTAGAQAMLSAATHAHLESLKNALLAWEAAFQRIHQRRPTPADVRQEQMGQSSTQMAECRGDAQCRLVCGGADVCAFC
jgi:hypothetical protein